MFSGRSPAIPANHVTFGIPPLRFKHPSDFETISRGDRLEIEDIKNAVDGAKLVSVRNTIKGLPYRMTHALSRRQVEMLLPGGLTRYLKARNRW